MLFSMCDLNLLWERERAQLPIQIMENVDVAAKLACDCIFYHQLGAIAITVLWHLQRLYLEEEAGVIMSFIIQEDGSI